MSDRPIIFSAPMVRALLAGTKTQTRRVLKPQPGEGASYFKSGLGKHIWDWMGLAFGTDDGRGLPRVPYAPGDRLWCREAWRCLNGLDAMSGSAIERQCVEEAGYQRAWAPIQYEADGERVNWYRIEPGFGTEPGRYRHARHMPRWASRLTLHVTEVRVQRLQEISEADAVAEGVDAVTLADVPRQAAMSRRADFAGLWNSLHGPGAWDGNPWVCAVSFTVERANIDAAREAQP